MTSRTSRWHVALGAGALLGLTACTYTVPAGNVMLPPAPEKRPAPYTQPSAPPADVKGSLKHALDLLEKGDEINARIELQAVLRDDPNNNLAKKLIGEITQDPKSSLGVKSFSYVIQPGETLSSLAEKFLGDKFLFYSLAKYNDILVPSRSEAGQTIQIPGVAKTVEPRRAAPPQPHRDSAQATRDPAPASRDPAEARKLRARALVLMSTGNAGEAAALLKQALTLDPGNALISTDLEKAQRIQGTAH